MINSRILKASINRTHNSDMTDFITIVRFTKDECSLRVKCIVAAHRGVQCRKLRLF